MASSFNPDTRASNAAETGADGAGPPAEVAGSSGEGGEAEPILGDTEGVGVIAESAEDAEFSVPDDELPDIGEASFGPPPPIAETVHGPDNRVQINTTGNFPWRMTCSLRITARDNSQWIGTGWFVGPRAVVTAGHCVFIKGSPVPGRDGWVKSIQVMPGRNGATLPFGVVTSSNLHSVLGWTNNGDENFDYGCIILPTNLGDRTGFFGIANIADAELLAATANITGYPGDKPAGTMWYDNKKVASVSSRKVHYDIDTAGGQSGAAVYRIKNGVRQGMAIHAYGGSTTNSGTRINRAVFDNITAWKAL